jgi:hypothetical protein
MLAVADPLEAALAKLVAVMTTVAGFGAAAGAV